VHLCSKPLGFSLHALVGGFFASHYVIRHRVDQSLHTLGNRLCVDVHRGSDGCMAQVCLSVFRVAPLRVRGKCPA